MKNQLKNKVYAFIKKFAKVGRVWELNDLELGRICYEQSWMNGIKFLSLDR